MSKIKFHDRALVIADDQLERTLGLAARAAKVSCPVLIVGETGTGKELIARYIHEKSDRRNQPFITVNCAAIPEGLMEAELFGYERGAFTGATARRNGKFELAHRGSILLDEISEMPPNLQTKLLRVIQEGEVDRLGSTRPTAVDARIIATTNRDPRGLIREGRFREDLFYRLNVVRIECVPLRGRESAIRSLAQEFIQQSQDQQQRGRLAISPEAEKLIREYGWPGNVRELRNAIERAVMLCDGNILLPEHFDCAASPVVSESTLSDVERLHILDVVGKSAGNRTEAARKLGISIRTLRNKLNEYSR